MLYQLSYGPTINCGLSIADCGFKRPPNPQSEIRNLAIGKGWLTGIEPATSGATVQRSNRLSYSHHARRTDAQTCRRSGADDNLNRQRSRQKRLTARGVGRLPTLRRPTYGPPATAGRDSDRGTRCGEAAMLWLKPCRRQNTALFRFRVAGGTHSAIEGSIMHERMTFAGVVGLLAAALLAVGCSDSVSPRGPAFDMAPTVVEVTGLGQLGTGSPSPGNNVQTFDFDVKSDLSGTLTYTDYTFPDTLLVGPTIPGTGITAFRTSSSACGDPTKGAEFDGTGQVFGETEMLNFTVAVCDNGPAGSGLDFFSFSAPSINYSKSATLTSGDIANSTGSSSAGSLVVSTSTLGSSLPSGYTATVDGTASQPIGINSSAMFTGLTATGHTVTLSGVPTNCTVSGGTSQTVTVPAGGTATAAFSVSCTATSGVEVSGTGQIGPGSPTAGSNLQTFTFDVTSDLSGTLTYTDYSISASLQVGPTIPRHRDQRVPHQLQRLQRPDQGRGVRWHGPGGGRDGAAELHRGRL